MIISDIDVITAKQEIVAAILLTCVGARADDVEVHTLKEKKGRGTQVAVY